MKKKYEIAYRKLCDLRSFLLDESDRYCCDRCGLADTYCLEFGSDHTAWCRGVRTGFARAAVLVENRIGELLTEAGGEFYE